MRRYYVGHTFNEFLHFHKLTTYSIYYFNYTIVNRRMARFQSFVPVFVHDLTLPGPVPNAYLILHRNNLMHQKYEEHIIIYSIF